MDLNKVAAHCMKKHKKKKAKMVKKANQAYGYGAGAIAQPKMMARGGVVKKPTLAMIGEEGPEAVIPLGKRKKDKKNAKKVAKNILEKNAAAGELLFSSGLGALGAKMKHKEDADLLRGGGAGVAGGIAGGALAGIPASAIAAALIGPKARSILAKKNKSFKDVVEAQKILAKVGIPVGLAAAAGGATGAYQAGKLYGKKQGLKKEAMNMMLPMPAPKHPHFDDKHMLMKCLKAIENMAKEMQEEVACGCEMPSWVEYKIYKSKDALLSAIGYTYSRPKAKDVIMKMKVM